MYTRQPKIRYIACLMAILLLAAFAVPALAAASPSAKSAASALLEGFLAPETEYMPKVRWWWPGGDIEEKELLRELQWLKDNNFGGAEIMPNSGGMPDSIRRNPEDPIHSYGDAAYYEKLRSVLEKAAELDLVIDINLGTGWTAGGESVNLEDNEWTYLVGRSSADALLTSKTNLTSLSIPEADQPQAYTTFAESNGERGFSGGSFSILNWDEAKAQQTLSKVIVARVSSVAGETMTLDQATVKDVSSLAKNGQINLVETLDIKAGERWVLIAIYLMPVGSNPVLTTANEKGYLLSSVNGDAADRFIAGYIDELKENGILEYTTGNGGALRAIFNDSFEFFAQRYAIDESEIKAKLGENYAELLPSIMDMGKDQMFNFISGTTRYFSYGADADARIAYDYDRAISDSILDGWYGHSAPALLEAGVILRQQGYNPPLDEIKAAGVKGIIPETENIDENTLRKVSSGAHIYGNSNLVSCESFVFYPGGNFSLTPQTYKAGIHTYMTSGVNEIIFHGMPYQWDRKGYSESGWSPFFTPTGTDIATIVGEQDASFSPYYADINLYAARLQYLMRQGDHKADVLLYMPTFGEADATLTTMLNKNSYTWDLLNDDVLQQARVNGEEVSLPGGKYQAIAVPSGVRLPLASAKVLQSLYAAGIPVILYGQKPSQQPSYLGGEEGYRDGDNSVKSAMQTIQSNPKNEEELVKALSAVKRDAYYEPNDSLRMAMRDYGDNGSMVFLHNTSKETADFTLHVKNSENVYYLDALRGEIFNAMPVNDVLKGTLEAESSICVWIAGKAELAEDALTQGNPVAKAERLSHISLTDWTLHFDSSAYPDEKAADIKIDAQNPLFDWADKAETKYLASPGEYSSSVTLHKSSGEKYILELGSIGAAAAEVKVNDDAYRKVLFAPYEIDITDALTDGENQITVKIVPAYRNRLIGLAHSPDEAIAADHAQMKEVEPLSLGLLGPASLTTRK